MILVLNMNISDISFNCFIINDQLLVHHNSFANITSEN